MQPILNPKQVEVLFVKSNDAPVLIFKHSTQCSLSGIAWGELKHFSETVDARGVAISFVHVIEDRPLSTSIADRTGVKHESPQAILLRRGEVIWHASHDGITRESLRHALRS